MRQPDCTSAPFGMAATLTLKVVGASAPNADRPLAALAGSHLAGRFRHWRGRSGERYLFSVFPLPAQCPLDRLPRYEQIVILAVRRDDDGARRILMAAETGPMPDLVFGGQALRQALAAGANEIHMHLLAEDGAARAAIVTDLG